MLTCIAVVTSLIKSVPDLCDEKNAQGFTCPGNNVFYRATVIWGVLYPQEAILSLGDRSGSCFQPWRSVRRQSLVLSHWCTGSYSLLFLEEEMAEFMGKAGEYATLLFRNRMSSTGHTSQLYDLGSHWVIFICFSSDL